MYTKKQDVSIKNTLNYSKKKKGYKIKNIFFCTSFLKAKKIDFCFKICFNFCFLNVKIKKYNKILLLFWIFEDVGRRLT
jgi:hypothetical protein